MEIKPGIYKGRGVAGSEQWGVAETGSAQVAVDVVIIGSLQGARFTVVLPFGGKAGPFSIDRLRKLGWAGSDILKLDGIDKNDVDVELFYEMFDGRQRLKCEIRTGDGTFRLASPMSDGDKKAFRDDVKALLARGSER